MSPSHTDVGYQFIILGINKGTPLTQYGPIWKQHRRFLNRALMAPVVKKDYSPVMTRKTLMFLKTLLDRPDDFLIENKKYELLLFLLHVVDGRRSLAATHLPSHNRN